MDQNKKHHYYTFPEIFGHFLVLAVLVVSLTGGLKLVEILLPTDQPAAAQTYTQTAPIASVSEFLNDGYLPAAHSPVAIAVTPL